MSFPPHTSYKPSGHDWLGNIPSDWRVQKFRHLFRESSEKIESKVFGEMLSVSGFRGIERKEYDDENRRRKDEDLIGYRIVRRGQLVVNTMWLNYAGLGFSDLDGHVSPAYRAYWPRTEESAKYLHYLLRSEIYVKGYTRLLTGVRPNSLQMSRDNMMGFPVILPGKEEQLAIARFLDRETAKIDALIAEQRRLIELLQEKRQAVISHAVTKGLNPNVPMKDSGVEWLGEVPEHWEAKPLRYVCKIQTGSRDTDEAVEDGDYPFFVRSQTVERINSCSFDCEAVLTAGDGAGVGKVFHYHVGPFDFHQRVYMLNEFNGIGGKLVYHFLKTNFFKVALQGGAKSTVDSLRRPMFTGFVVCIPPHSEQEHLLRYVEEQEAGLGRLITTSEKAILLLQERRSALISAAVTGQIDVRGLVPEAAEQ